MKSLFPIALTLLFFLLPLIVAQITITRNTISGSVPTYRGCSSKNNPNRVGSPVNPFHVPLSSAFISKVQTIFAEKTKPDSAFISENIFFAFDCDGVMADITFVWEGTGNANSFGYLTYNKTTGKIFTENLVFPDVSQTACLISGTNSTTVRIGPFDRTETLAFYIISNGYNNPNNAVFRSIHIPSLNLTNSDGYQHIALMFDADTNRTVFGFEDLSGLGDQDYNDVIFSVNFSDPCYDSSRFAVVENGVLVTCEKDIPIITNMVTYNGVQYALLDNSDPNDAIVGCQPSGTRGMYIPSGWALCNLTSAAFNLLGCHDWGTECVVFANGSSLNPRTGSVCGTADLDFGKNGTAANAAFCYNPANCNKRVMITRTAPAGTSNSIPVCSTAVSNPVVDKYVVVNGNRYATCDNTPPNTLGNSNQTAWVTAPASWTILRNLDEDAYAAVLSGSWGTSCIVGSNGNGYLTDGSGVCSATCQRGSSSRVYSSRGRVFCTQEASSDDVDKAVVPITNFITFQGNDYAVMDNTHPESLYPLDCQSYTIKMPSGWSVASDSVQTRAAIFGNRFRFGTACLVVQEGTGINSQSGESCGSGLLRTTGNYFEVSSCSVPRKVLISRTSNFPNTWNTQRTLSEYVNIRGQLFGTLDNTHPFNSTGGCQDVGMLIPSGWKLAPDDRSTLSIIQATEFGTDCLVTASGIGYSSSGVTCGSNLLLNYTNYLAPRFCNSRILITQLPTSASSPGFALAWGDPHFTTFDGETFSFHGVGEFWLSRGLSGANPFNIQARQFAISNASAISAVAVSSGGSTVTVLTSSSVNGDPAVRIGSTLITSFPATSGILTVTKNGTLGNDLKFIIDSSTGDQLVAVINVWPTVQSMTLYLRAATDRFNTLGGLLGNFDLVQNDAPEFNNTHTWGSTFRITQAESFFWYGPNESTTTFTDVNYVPTYTIQFSSAAQESAATSACFPLFSNRALYNACLFDIAAMSTSEVASSSVGAGQTATANTFQVISASTGGPNTRSMQRCIECSDANTTPLYSLGFDTSSLQFFSPQNFAVRDGNTFLGPFNAGQTVTFSYNIPSSVLENLETITVSWRIRTIGSWNGNNLVNNVGLPQGVFDWSIASACSERTTFSNVASYTQSYPSAYQAAYASNTGAIWSSTTDSLFDFKKCIRYPSPLLTITLSAPSPSAVQWGIDSLNVAYIVSPCRGNQRSVLSDLYTATNGPQWAVKTGWLVNSDECSWYGVFCESSCVTSINLENNALAGTIPSTLGSLTTLKYLNLGYNNISGSLPASLFDLKNLQLLRLGSNQISGEIPELSAGSAGLSSVELIDLSTNRLSGSIKSHIVSGSKLAYLNVADNALSGCLPQSLHSINPASLRITDNYFACPLPGWGSAAQAQCGCSPSDGCIVYAAQFDTSVPTEFNNTAAFFKDLTLGGLMGVLGSTTVQASFESLPLHSGAVVFFDLYAIGTCNSDADGVEVIARMPNTTGLNDSFVSAYDTKILNDLIDSDRVDVPSQVISAPIITSVGGTTATKWGVKTSFDHYARRLQLRFQATMETSSCKWAVDNFRLGLKKMSTVVGGAYLAGNTLDSLNPTIIEQVFQDAICSCSSTPATVPSGTLALTTNNSVVCRDVCAFSSSCPYTTYRLKTNECTRQCECTVATGSYKSSCTCPSNGQWCQTQVYVSGTIGNSGKRTGEANTPLSQFSFNIENGYDPVSQVVVSGQTTAEYQVTQKSVWGMDNTQFFQVPAYVILEWIHTLPDPDSEVIVYACQNEACTKKEHMDVVETTPGVYSVTITKSGVYQAKAATRTTESGEEAKDNTVLYASVPAAVGGVLVLVAGVAVGYKFFKTDKKKSKIAPINEALLR